MEATIVFKKNWDAIHAVNPDGTRKYRYIVNRGSSRSSKTISLIDCYDLYARSSEGKRLTVWRDTKTDCKKTVLVDAIKHMKRTNRYGVAQDFNKTESIFTYRTGSTFEIHGTDDEETVHGLTQDAAWMNEPYKIGRDTFDQIDQRTSDFIFIDWNPKKSHWIEDLLKDPRTIEIGSTFKDNPFCPPEQKTKILSYQPVGRCDILTQKLLTEQEARAYDLLNNPADFTPKQIKELTRCRDNEAKNSANDFNWCVYGLGTKGERPHRIFHWKEISIEDYHKLQLPTYYGCDWGTVDPWGILEAKYNDNRLYLRERNYRSENQIRETLTPHDLAVINAAAGTFEEKQESTGLVTWVFSKLGIPKDRPTICDTNRPIKGNALRKAGFQPVPAMKLPGSILDGIDLLNNLEVFYTSDSPNLKEEQENYSRVVDKYGVVQEEPEDLYNHLIDPARYIAQYLSAKGILRRL